MSDGSQGEINHHEMRLLRAEVRELSQQVHDLVEAWNTARGMVKFIKLLGSIATAGGAIWLMIQAIWPKK
ncbi:hypothetical protein B0E46_15765 [Rhodanobacter sp. B04]|uniref:hypothetical protein n=1 Tax=Rhodanobacter sp. B04 TaxID=1945860 RepID=UPI0009D27A3D|nr:hypothetical protein [Rhodanobacter sp. B04]OOG61433.1 hypothetical protein B0E46_15765 [Rhodanobacter sp. B04]